MDKGRQMGLAATIAVVTGESIALGIFLTPAAMARSLGSPVLLAAVWCGMQTGLALLVLGFGAFDRILSFIIFSAVCFLALSVVSLLRLREPIDRWWFPAAPVVFLSGCVAINLMIVMHDPLPALIGFAIVLCGDPVRRFFFSKSSVAASALSQQISQ